jgi:hypothetical protein
LHKSLTERLILSGRRYFQSDRGRFTKIAPKSMVIDEAKLKRRIGAKEWRRITMTVINEKALAGELAKQGTDSDFARAVAECSKEVTGTAYGRVSRR